MSATPVSARDPRRRGKRRRPGPRKPPITRPRMADRDAEQSLPPQACAKVYRMVARDLRFRCASRGTADFNSVVARVAADQGARVVDVHGAFVAGESGRAGRGNTAARARPHKPRRLFPACGRVLLRAGRQRAARNPESTSWPQRLVQACPSARSTVSSATTRFCASKAGWPFSNGPRSGAVACTDLEGERLAQELYHERSLVAEAQDRLQASLPGAGQSRRAMCT